MPLVLECIQCQPSGTGSGTSVKKLLLGNATYYPLCVHALVPVPVPEPVPDGWHCMQLNNQISYYPLICGRSTLDNQMI